jgi:glycosyltransferase involved in cell wall biosynthesis
MISKVGIVLQAASTGGWRFTHALCRGIREKYPRTNITVYLDESVSQAFALDDPISAFHHLQVQVETFVHPLPVKKRNGLRYLASRPKYWKHERKLLRQRESMEQKDLIFYAWPYDINYPDLIRPVAFIPHDFFYLHFMGSFQVTNAVSTHRLREHKRWMELGYPVVSTRFIASELESAFPNHKNRATVIHLSRLSQTSRLSDPETETIIHSLGLRDDYILNINNASYHKNLGQVLAAFYYLTQDYPQLKLIVCGYGTEGVQGRMNTPNYLDLNDTHPNVLCLGMRSDQEIAALIQRAKLVVNASLYEAGNGSGLDAWYLGTPVAMSNIPPFLEQIEELGVRATTFNPRCCFEMRQAMQTILASPSIAQEMVATSRASMEKYSWDVIAEKYMTFFEQSIRDHNAKST